MNVLEAAKLGQSMGSATPMAIAGNTMGMRDLPVPRIANTINAAPARLQEMDKIKYQERMKENLRQQRYNSLDSALRDERKFEQDMILQEIANEDAIARQELADKKAIALEGLRNQNSLSREEIRNKNVLDAQKAGAELQLETEDRKLSLAQQKSIIGQELKDKKYKPVREIALRRIQEYEDWVGGEAENQYDLQFREKLINYAVSTFSETDIHQRYKKDYPKVTQMPKPGSKEYMDYAIILLRESEQFDTVTSKVDEAVRQEIRQIGSERAGNYKATIEQLNRLGLTLPDITITDYNPIDPSTQYPDTRGGLPASVILDEIKGSEGGGSGGGRIDSTPIGAGQNYQGLNPFGYGSDPTAPSSILQRNRSGGSPLNPRVLEMLDQSVF
jgi:hypothetical protein